MSHTLLRGRGRGGKRALLLALALSGLAKAHAAGPGAVNLSAMHAHLCPRPLSDEAASVPTLRVALLWRMNAAQSRPTQAPAALPGSGLSGLSGLSAMSGLLGLPSPLLRPLRKHPSEPLPAPGSAEDQLLTPQVRMDGLSYGAGRELLAGRLETAQTQLQACQARARAEQDGEADAACTHNLGVLYAARGRYAEAQQQLQSAATLYQQVLAAQAATAAPAAGPAQGAAGAAGMGDAEGHSDLLQAMAASMAQLGRMGPAIGVMRSAVNQGQLALAMGRLEPAERHLQEALQAADGLPGTCRDVVAADLARLYRRLGRQGEAQALAPLPSQQGLPGQVPTSGSVDGLAGDMGMIALAPAGAALATATPSAQPLPPGMPRVMALNDEPLALGSEARLQALLARAAGDEQAGRWAGATQAYGRVALVAAALQRPDTEATARAGLMRVHAAAGRPGAAIAHGKRAVQLLQAAQAAEGGARLDRATRRALLRQREQWHAQLVRLMLAGQRLTEAEQVLQLQRLDEGLQFAALQATRRAPAATHLANTPAEQARIEREADAGAALMALEERRVALVAQPEFRPALQSYRGGLEQVRLLAAEDVLDVLGPARGANMQADLRSANGELRSLLQALMADRGARLVAALRQGAEDVARFNDPPPTEAQRATVLEAARRASEFATAFAPFAEQLQREPALSGAAWRDAQGPAVPALVPAVTAPDLGRVAAQALRSVRDVLRGLGGRSNAPAETSTPTTSASPTASVRAHTTAAPAARHIRGALAVVEIATQLWRLDEERERLEAAFQAREREALPALEAPAAAALADDSAMTLARLAPEAALLHYLPGEEHTDVLLVSARGRSTLRLPLPQARLDALVQRLQGQLRDPRQDPRATARALHDALLLPLRPQLDAAGTQVLLLSLQGRLRFLPFAALHDGQGWLVERYAVVVHPGARLETLLQPSAPRWRVAAFGASAGGAGLSPLPAVPRELRSVVQAAGSAPASTAAGGRSPWPGRRGTAYLDAAFNAAALRQALGSGAQALHIASHFHFEPGDAAASFLLLGDGSRLSLQALGGGDYRFDPLELVALSACQTGLSQDDAYGQEVDGLGALLMAQGARAVLASLWQVADDSTGTLMGTLYALREREGEGGPALPLAQALRQAQLAMIRGAATAEPLAAQRGAGRRFDDEPPGAGGTAAGALAPLNGQAHPFHWAPFVLMGNWR